jgi:diguanylate cyclase (GGDEF)-like protein
LLLTHVRRSEFVFRWGGDEFVAMMSCDAAQARAKAEEIRGAFRRDPMVRQLSVTTGLSVGCIEVPRDAVDLMPLVGHADQRMYADKWRSA